MGKIIVTLTILFLIFLFFQGFSAIEDYLANGEGAQHAQSAVVSMLEPWTTLVPSLVAAEVVAIT